MFAKGQRAIFVVLKKRKKVVADIIRNEARAFLAGRKAFKENKPQPDDKWADKDWDPPLNVEQFYFMGYLVERSVQLLKQDHLRDWAEKGGFLPEDNKR